MDNNNRVVGIVVTSYTYVVAAPDCIGRTFAMASASSQVLALARLSSSLRSTA